MHARNVNGIRYTFVSAIRTSICLRYNRTVVTIVARLNCRVSEQSGKPPQRLRQLRLSVTLKRCAPFGLFPSDWLAVVVAGVSSYAG